MALSNFFFILSLFSIAASNFSSDQGSVDSCHYSSNGSDSNSGSSPCSPEEPDRCSRAGTPQPMPPIPPSLRDDGQIEEEQCYAKQQNTSESKQCIYEASRTDVVNLCNSNERISIPEQTDSNQTKFKNELASTSEDIKHFYLQSSLVPNSNSVSFQRAETQNCVSKYEQFGESSCSMSEKTVSCSESSSHSTHLLPYTKQTIVQANSSSNSTNQSNCSSTELQRCNWQHCKSSLEGNSELVEHIRSHHVQVQKDSESFVCLWEGCKVII